MSTVILKSNGTRTSLCPTVNLHKLRPVPAGSFRRRRTFWPYHPLRTYFACASPATTAATLSSIWIQPSS